MDEYLIVHGPRMELPESTDVKLDTECDIVFPAGIRCDTIPPLHSWPCCHGPCCASLTPLRWLWRKINVSNRGRKVASSGSRGGEHEPIERLVVTTVHRGRKRDGEVGSDALSIAIVVWKNKAFQHLESGFFLGC